MSRFKQKELLVELRSKLVGKLHTQPFTIYNDETIELLLDKQPTSIEELEDIKGFPKDGKRVKGFGQAIIAIFTNPKVESIEIDGDESDLSVRTFVTKAQGF